MKRGVLVFLINAAAGLQLLAHVELNSPAGGETYHPGDTVNILWTETVKHNTLNWDLLFSEDGGLSWSILKEDIARETRSHQWIVPELISAKGRIKIIQDNEGEDYENSSRNFAIAPISIIQVSDGNKAIRMYPNPITDIAIIELEKHADVPLRLTIYNSLGQEVRTRENISSGIFEFRRENLAPGAYILRLTDGMQVRASGKLIIR